MRNELYSSKEMAPIRCLSHLGSCSESSFQRITSKRAIKPTCPTWGRVFCEWASCLCEQEKCTGRDRIHRVRRTPSIPLQERTHRPDGTNRQTHRRAGKEEVLRERVLFVFHTERFALLALSVSQEKKSVHVEEEEPCLPIRHCLNGSFPV